MNTDYRNTPQGHGYILLSDGSIYTLDAHPRDDVNARYIDSHVIPRCSVCSHIASVWHSFTQRIHTAWSHRPHHWA